MYKSYSMELAGRTLTVDIGRVAKQANGAALMHYGDTTVLSTATASKEPREGIDFFPLSVEYEEKMYAVGKIPGGFNKREGKASEHAILTSRVIDRPMRPLFPKDYRNDVTLVNMVMSVDPECNPEIPAMLGSSIATCISDIPFDGPCATTQVGLIDGEFIINPSLAQKELSDLQLTVASTREKVIMIEAGANEVPEDTMIEAIYKAHDVNQEIIRFIDKIVAECGKEKHLYASCAVPEELFEAIKKIVPSEEMEEAVFTDDKQTREENIREITARLQDAFADNEEWLAVLVEACALSQIIRILFCCIAAQSLQVFGEDKIRKSLLRAVGAFVVVVVILMVRLNLGYGHEEGLFAGVLVEVVQRELVDAVSTVALKIDAVVVLVEHIAVVAVGGKFQHIGCTPVAGVAAAQLQRNGCNGMVNGRLLFQLAIRGQMPLADIGSFVAGIFFHILAQSLDIRGQHQVIAETACLSGVFSGLE